MPIESIFLPDEGLQGEDIPSHIIWKDMNYNLIRIIFPPILRLKEIYNVSEDQWVMNKNTLTVKGVEVDGYLGLLFESLRSDEEKEKYGEVEYRFINTEDKIIFQTKKSIRLFRPFIFLEDVPQSINIVFPNKEIDKKIKLTNSGEGTAIIGIETTEKSEIRETPSKIVEDFMSEFIKDLEKEILRLKEEFSAYSQFLDTFFLYEKEPKWEIEEFVDDVEQIMEKDKEFSHALVQSFAWAIMNNIHFDTIIESFVSYLDSLATNKILIYNPLDVIEVSETPKRIDLKVLQKDLLMKEYDPLEIPTIVISANMRDIIELHRLFEWGGSNGS
ncbi:MAG: hypothetical protein KAT65_00490 [Methanophagales archaeon]|nr:hypothetical protein [Methanophagales archaeon]